MNYKYVLKINLGSNGIYLFAYCNVKTALLDFEVLRGKRFEAKYRITLLKFIHDILMPVKTLQTYKKQGSEENPADFIFKRGFFNGFEVLGGKANET